MNIVLHRHGRAPRETLPYALTQPVVAIDIGVGLHRRIIIRCHGHVRQSIGKQRRKDITQTAEHIIHIVGVKRLILTLLGQPTALKDYVTAVVGIDVNGAVTAGHPVLAHESLAHETAGKIVSGRRNPARYHLPQPHHVIARRRAGAVAIGLRTAGSVRALRGRLPHISGKALLQHTVKLAVAIDRNRPGGRIGRHAGQRTVTVELRSRRTSAFTETLAGASGQVSIRKEHLALAHITVILLMKHKVVHSASNRTDRDGLRREAQAVIIVDGPHGTTDRQGVNRGGILSARHAHHSSHDEIAAVIRTGLGVYACQLAYACGQD